MIPSKGEKATLNYEDWWGYDWTAQDNAAMSTKNIAACFAQSKHINCYYSAHYNKKKNYYCLPDIMSDVGIGHLLNSGFGEPIYYEYRPELSILKTQNTYPPYMFNKSEIYFVNRNIIRQSGKLVNDSQSDEKTVEAQLIDTVAGYYPEEITSVYKLYAMSVEMSGYLSHGRANMRAQFVQSTLHCGVFPINAFTNDPNVNSTKTVFAYWMVETEMTVDFDYDFIRPYGSVSHPNNVICCSGVDVTNIDICDQVGYGRRLMRAHTTPQMGQFDISEPVRKYRNLSKLEDKTIEWVRCQNDDAIKSYVNLHYKDPAAGPAPTKDV